MTNVQAVKRAVRSALEIEAKERTIEKGFQSGKFKIDEDDWDKLVRNLHIQQLKKNCYRVSLQHDISVNIQPGLGVEIGAASGTLVGAGVGGVSGATIGAIVGSVVPGPGTIIGAVVGGLIGTGVGGGVGGTGGAGGGAVIGKAVKKYEQNFRLNAADILSRLNNFRRVDNTVYATVEE